MLQQNLCKKPKDVWVLVCNQVAYHLNDRRIESSELPYCQQEGITIMGYSPFGYAPHIFGMAGFPEVGTSERDVLDKIGIGNI
ncbi:aldo/keto reductase [Paenibacillus sp. V4I3]|uniref:aldo/keto reductase n=1 Tax=Paenibacillus sp. V4I3 TaxID=3042305 RepID=UPI0027D8744A|nr:aldo/keto reductase [Paenibacillus sp. V4I3]